MLMARVGLGLSARELANSVGVNKKTISNIETERHTRAGSKRAPTLKKIREWLEEKVIFIDAIPGQHGPGVILREGVAEKSLSHRATNGANGAGDQITASWEQELDVPQMSEIAVGVRFS